MRGKVKPRARRYHSPSREEASRQTRAAILEAARMLFMRDGYASTTTAAIAAQAGVALDTVYAAVGRKPALFRLLIEMAISGEAAPVPSEERAYVKNIRAARSAREKFTIYARALTSIHARLAPLFLVLRAAASSDPQLASLWKEISDRRALMMRRFAADLRSTGELRSDLSLGDIADAIWSMNAPEYYVMLVDERGWTTKRFERWLVDAWSRLFLRPA
jgi:AcrR family transcriptional regulator